MVTYATEACRTVIDYFLIMKNDRKVRDIKVLHEDPCIKHRKLLVCVLDLEERLERPKVKFVKRCKVWKLREADTASIFRERECR